MTLPVNISNLTTAIDNTLTRTSMSEPDGKEYIKMDKTGHWIYGRDDIEVEEGSKWAINPNSFALGFIAWGNAGKPAGEEMRLITDDPLIESELPDVDGQWEQQVAMQMACISGEDKGTQAIYKSSSKGGRGAFNDLIRAVMDTLQLNQGTDKVVPVVTLEVESYKHDSYGKIFKPVFNIVEWATMNDTIDNMDDDAEEEPAPAIEEEPAPKRRARRKRA